MNREVIEAKEMVRKWALQGKHKHEIGLALVYCGDKLVDVTDDFMVCGDWIWSENNTEETPIKIIDVATGKEIEW